MCVGAWVRCGAVVRVRLTSCCVCMGPNNLVSLSFLLVRAPMLIDLSSRSICWPSLLFLSPSFFVCVRVVHIAGGACCFPRVSSVCLGGGCRLACSRAVFVGSWCFRARVCSGCLVSCLCYERCVCRSVCGEFDVFR